MPNVPTMLPSLAQAILIRPVVHVCTRIWKTVRIENGSQVTLHMIGDRQGFDPRILCIGLSNVGSVCFVHLRLIVANTGLAAVRNLAVRVNLPRSLTPSIDMPQVRLPTGESTFTVAMDPDTNQRTFHLPSLRIDETAVLPLVLRIAPSDWLSVPVGPEGTRRGDLSLSPIGRPQELIKLVILSVAVTAHADNIRASQRRFELWFSPASTEAEIKAHFRRLATVAQIWRHRYRAFLLPAIGPFVWMPSFPRAWFFDRAAVLNLVSTKAVAKPEPGRWFDLDREFEFVPAEVYRHLVANPGSKRGLFRQWVEDVYALRPKYFR